MLPWAFAESQSTREVRLKTDRGAPPIWLMGMCNATMGFSNGMVLFAAAAVVAAEQVPEWQIAAITAVAFSPNFWSVLFAPILDVRFSRRWYATVLASVCAISTAAGVLSLHHLVLLESHACLYRCRHLIEFGDGRLVLEHHSPKGQKYPQ